MTNPIQIFRGGQDRQFMAVEFMDVVRIALERLLRWDLEGAQIQVVLVCVPDSFPAAPGSPRVENLIPEFGYARVTVIHQGRVIYRHPHPVLDLLTDVLRELLRKEDPDEMLWTFRIDVPGLPDVSSYRPAPAVAGAIEIQPYAPGETPAFTVRRVAEEDPPVRTLRDFGLDAMSGTEGPPVQVVVAGELREDLMRRRPFSPDVEEGGFLVGRVFRDGDRPDGYLVEVTGAPGAEHTGASLLHFTFTGESFVEVRRSLQRDRPGDRLVGWYHTHLFAATEDFGLSSIDLVLHFGTFTIPWQVAGLVNVDGDTRTLRFYVRQGNTMVQCVHWVLDERSEHSLARD